jgi:hypothetical protein
MTPALLLLLLAPTIAPTPAAATAAAVERVERTHDFAGLTPAQASRLQGQRARFRLALDSRQDTTAGRTFYDCESSDRTARTVWLVEGQEAAQEMDVEATLQVVHEPRWVGPGGAVVERFTEYRLLAARRCE